MKDVIKLQIQINIDLLKLYLKIVFIMALYPLGLALGYALSFPDNIDVNIGRNALFTGICLLIISGIISSILAFAGEKTNDLKKLGYFQLISIVCWLPVGIIPGIIGFGWKYTLVATILPSITLYQFFEWNKQIAKNRMKKDIEE